MTKLAEFTKSAKLILFLLVYHSNQIWLILNVNNDNGIIENTNVSTKCIIGIGLTFPKAHSKFYKNPVLSICINTKGKYCFDYLESYPS